VNEGDLILRRTEVPKDMALAQIESMRNLRDIQQVERYLADATRNCN
jgi:hypothetical protein